MTVSGLDSILNAIAGLSLRDRDRLWRRARQMGLLPEEGKTSPTAPSLQSVLRSVPPANSDQAPAHQPSLLSTPPPAQVSPAIDRVKLTFDGGSKGNPGPGYGSYVVEWNKRAEPVQRLDLGANMTNNEAEYDILIAALESILAELDGSRKGPQQVHLEVWGDSKLVISQITGAWKAKEPRLRQRRDRARALLARFGQARLHHHGRANSVAMLGH